MVFIVLLALSIGFRCYAQAPPVDVSPVIQIADDKEAIVKQWEHNAQT